MKILGFYLKAKRDNPLRILLLVSVLKKATVS